MGFTAAAVRVAKDLPSFAPGRHYLPPPVRSSQPSESPTPRYPWT